MRARRTRRPTCPEERKRTRSRLRRPRSESAGSARSRGPLPFDSGSAKINGGIPPPPIEPTGSSATERERPRALPALSRSPKARPSSKPVFSRRPISERPPAESVAATSRGPASCIGDGDQFGRRVCIDRPRSPPRPDPRVTKPEFPLPRSAKVLPIGISTGPPARDFFPQASVAQGSGHRASRWRLN